MSELLAKFDGGELIGLAAVLGGLLVAALAVATYQWKRVRLAELNSALKQQMLEKGMTASEIEQVINAGHLSHSDGATGDAAVDRATLAQQMIDNGYEGEDIERVLRAYEAPRLVEERAAR